MWGLVSLFSSHKLLPQCHTLAPRVGVPVLPGLWVEVACPPSLHTLPDIPQLLIILGLLHNVFPCLNTPSQHWAPTNTMFQEQLPGTQVTASKAPAPGIAQSLHGVVPGGCKTSAHLPRGHQRLSPQSRLSHWRLEHPNLPLCRGLKATSLCSDHAGHLCSLHTCHQQRVQPTRPDIPLFKQQSTSATSSEISTTYCSDVNQQQLTKGKTTKHTLAVHLNSSLPPCSTCEPNSYLSCCRTSLTWKTILVWFPGCVIRIRE